MSTLPLSDWVTSRRAKEDPLQVLSTLGDKSENEVSIGASDAPDRWQLTGGVFTAAT